MAKRRTEIIKFGEFMSGEYKNKAKEKETVLKPILKVAQYSVVYTIATKVALPTLLVAIPIAMIAKTIPAMAATTTVAAASTAVPVSMVSDAVRDKIIHAFDPLVDLMVGLSVPIAGVMVTGGALLILIGRKDAGFKLIMEAALGYVLVQLSPMFIDLLIGIGKAV